MYIWKLICVHVQMYLHSPLFFFRRNYLLVVKMIRIKGAILKVLKTVEFNISDKGMSLVLSNSIENLVTHVKLILRTMGCIQDCFKSLACPIFSQ